MKITVLNGSPAGKNSITLQTVLYIEKYFSSCSFQVLHVGQKIRSIEKDFQESEKLLKEADLLLFCYPVYTFLVPAQLHRFIELIKEHRIDLSGKYATQLSTSKHFYDTTAHRFIQDNCDDMGLRYIKGLSADMVDLLDKKGQKDALAFFSYVQWCMEHHFAEPALYPMRDYHFPVTQKQAFIKDAGQKHTTMTYDKSKNPASDDPQKRLVIVTDSSVSPDDSLKKMIRCFISASTGVCNLVDLAEFPFAGGCLGCFHCAGDGKCVYKDGFDDYLRSHIQSADAIVYAFSIKDHSMGYRFKLYDDRQFCNGHRTVTMGKPVGYLVSGIAAKTTLPAEPNLKTLLEARSQVGGNFLAGIADDSSSGQTEEKIIRLAATLDYAISHHYQPPKNFYGVGGLKIFRDLIYQMQGLMREDHRFYKKHGFYDFPQKKKGRILAMYLVGTMMNSKSLSKKIGGRMTEGMLMPYHKVLKNADADLRKQ